MTVDLPSPRSMREKKKRRTAALLDAQIYLPRLVDRLSAGLLAMNTETACRWAGWIESLRTDPGWELIEPALDISEAWPEIWQRARDAGFSDKTEHHQAIFFSRLFERAIDESRFEIARPAWMQALGSWKSLADETYLREEILAPAADDLSDDQIDEVLASLFDGPLETVGNLGVEALRLQSWDAPPGRRPLRFVLGALKRARSIVSEDFQFSSSPLSTGIREKLDAIELRLHRAVAGKLENSLESLDYDRVERQQIASLFDHTLSRVRHLQNPPQLDRIVLRRGLDLIWDLRDLGRDDELAIIPPMVERLEPCAERLEDAGGDDFFGLEGAVADLLVFKGEEALSLDNRQQAYERALEVCPNHRNASRLLSYVLLERANRQLLKLSPFPDATARVGAARSRIQSTLTEVEDWVDRAETLYPENDLLDQYRDDLAEEIKRFKLAYQQDHHDDD